MALIKFSPTVQSSSPHVKKSTASSRILGTGPKVLTTLYDKVLDYMKNRRVRLLDLFGMLSNEKKVITVASLQKSLPTIGVNSTKEAIIYFVRALAGQTLAVTYSLFAQGVAQHRKARRQTGLGTKAKTSPPNSVTSRLSRPAHGPSEKAGRTRRPHTAKLTEVNKSVETEVKRRRSLAHELGTLKLEQVEDEISNAMHTSSAADMTRKVSADLQQHVQQFLDEADDNDAKYDRLRAMAESEASLSEITARAAALQARVRSSLRLGKVAVAIKRRQMQRTERQIELAMVFARSVQGMFSSSVDQNDVSAPSFNTFADQRIAQQLDLIQTDLVKWCNGSDGVARS